MCDNGSTDATREIVAGFASRVPGLRVLDASDARGAAHARNVGAAAGGDLIAYCDADDEVEPGWLAALVRTAAGRGRVGGSLEHQALNDPEIAALRGGAETALPRGLRVPAVRHQRQRRRAPHGVGGDRWLGRGVPHLRGRRVLLARAACRPGARLRPGRGGPLPAPARRCARAHARSTGTPHSSARLYRRYRGAGAQRRSLRGVASLVGLPRHAPAVRRPLAPPSRQLADRGRGERRPPTWQYPLQGVLPMTTGRGPLGVRSRDNGQDSSHGAAAGRRRATRCAAGASAATSASSSWSGSATRRRSSTSAPARARRSSASTRRIPSSRSISPPTRPSGSTMRTWSCARATGPGCRSPTASSPSRSRTP